MFHGLKRQFEGILPLRRQSDHGSLLCTARKDSEPIFLGENDEDFPHFNFLEDLGKRPRSIMDIFVRGPVFEYLAILYHETGDKAVLKRFEDFSHKFFENYPLVLEYTGADASRFSFTDERDVMSTGWLTLQYISLFYTRLPYEIPAEDAFEFIKRIWFMGIQFARFEHDEYRKYNHHMWGARPCTLYPGNTDAGDP